MSLQFGSEKYMFVQVKSLKLLGIKLPGTDFTALHLSVPFWIFFAGNLFQMTCLSIGSMKNITDLDMIVEAMIPLIQTSLSVWKMLIFLNTKKPIMELMREIRAKSLEANEKEFEIIKNENGRDTVLNRIYYVSCICCGTSCYLCPLAISIFLTISKKTMTLIIPVQGSYPVDVTQLHFYVMIFGTTMLSVHFSVFATIAMDGVFSWIVHNISAKFQILELKLLDLAEKNIQTKDLLDCISFHQWVLDIVDKFAKLFRPIIFVEIFLCCMQLCFAVFRMVQGLSSKSTPFAFAFVIVVFLQLYIYCYQGQRIQDGSENIATTIYECFHWNNDDNKDHEKRRKLLLISMARSQRCCKLDGIFFTANLELFLWVVRTASSYVTALKSFG